MEKVLFALFILEEEAAHWWKATMETYVNQPPMNWEKFKELFTGCYYPKSYRYRMEREFIDLKQGNMSVAAYVNEFTRLSRYAPHMVHDKEAKTRRFVHGLRQPIHNIIYTAGVTDLQQAVEMAT